MFKQGGEWVFAKANKWFEQTGQVLTRMTDETFKTAKRWTQSLFVRASTVCPVGFKDDGFYCAKPASFGRGTGSFSEATCIAEAKALGSSTCERSGLLYYPKCKTNLHSFGCCMCSPDCPVGWEDIGMSCLKPLPPTGAPVAVAASGRATK